MDGGLHRRGYRRRGEHRAQRGNRQSRLHFARRLAANHVRHPSRRHRGRGGLRGRCEGNEAQRTEILDRVQRRVVGSLHGSDQRALRHPRPDHPPGHPHRCRVRTDVPRILRHGQGHTLRHGGRCHRARRRPVHTRKRARACREAQGLLPRDCPCRVGGGHEAEEVGHQLHHRCQRCGTGQGAHRPSDRL